MGCYLRKKYQRVLYIYRFRENEEKRKYEFCLILKGWQRGLFFSSFRLSVYVYDKLLSVPKKKKSLLETCRGLFS